MVVLSGADLVLPDRILPSSTLVLDRGRIVEIRPGGRGALDDHYIVPGFIDVHVHGVDGIDTLDANDEAVGTLASRLPRYGVTSFCPTTMACGPEALRRVLMQVDILRRAPRTGSARVLPAHLESNFLNPAYRGAQPSECLRIPRERVAKEGSGAFSASEILDEMDRASRAIGIVTLAPELEGGLELIGRLVERGHAVSLGHSGATFDEAQAAIAAGAEHATHLFNRMPPFHHRRPGLVGAVLQSDRVVAELICDGVHVHPAVIRSAVAAKGVSRILAVTDATAGAGIASDARLAIGGQSITVRDGAAYLDDGTLAGGVATMDRVFRTLVEVVGLSVVDAANLCSTSAARALGLNGYGVLEVDAVADVVVLDRRFRVTQTYIGGRLVCSADSAEA